MPSTCFSTRMETVPAVLRTRFLLTARRRSISGYEQTPTAMVPARSLQAQAPFHFQYSPMNLFSTRREVQSSGDSTKIFSLQWRPNLVNIEATRTSTLDLGMSQQCHPENI